MRRAPVGLALLLWPVLGSAENAHPVAVYGVVSVPGGPLGMVGAELAVSPTERIGTTIGAGLGFNTDIDGWRAVPRLGASVGYRPWLAEERERSSREERSDEEGRRDGAPILEERERSSREEGDRSTGAAGFWLTGSTGPYHEREFTIEAGVAKQAYEIERAYWAGLAFAGERRFASGLSVKGSLGLEYLVNSGAGRCYEREYGSEARSEISCEHVNRFTLSPFFPAASLAVGYAF